MKKGDAVWDQIIRNHGEMMQALDKVLRILLPTLVKRQTPKKKRKAAV